MVIYWKETEIKLGSSLQLSVGWCDPIEPVYSASADSNSAALSKYEADWKSVKSEFISDVDREMKRLFAP